MSQGAGDPIPSADDFLPTQPTEMITVCPREVLADRIESLCVTLSGSQCLRVEASADLIGHTCSVRAASGGSCRGHPRNLVRTKWCSVSSFNR